VNGSPQTLQTLVFFSFTVNFNFSIDHRMTDISLLATSKYWGITQKQTLSYTPPHLRPKAEWGEVSSQGKRNARVQ
jgi:hypothetical protein